MNATGKKLLFTTGELVLMAILSATLTAGKLALSYLPNIEIVTLMLMIYTVTLGVKRSFAISVVFVLTECLIYGFNSWTVMYFLIWPLLVVLTGLLQPLFDRIRFGGEKVWLQYVGQSVGYVLLAGVYGFAFGFLCAVVEAAFFGASRGYFNYLFAYWMSGIPFDVTHAVSNVIIAAVLFAPLRHLFGKLMRGYRSISVKRR